MDLINAITEWQYDLLFAELNLCGLLFARSVVAIRDSVETKHDAGRAIVLLFSPAAVALAFSAAMGGPAVHLEAAVAIMSVVTVAAGQFLNVAKVVLEVLEMTFRL